MIPVTEEIACPVCLVVHGTILGKADPVRPDHFSYIRTPEVLPTKCPECKSPLIRKRGATT